MKPKLAKCAIVTLLAFAHRTGWAEDIDLFVGAQPGSAEMPNVLFIIDNTANWTQAFGNETSALQTTFNNLPLNADGTPRFNVGVMFAAETGSTDNNISGGYVRAAMRPMDTDTQAKYATMIGTLDVNGDKGNGGASSLVLAEAYRYFTGGTPYAGNHKAKADYAGNTTAEFPNTATEASRAIMEEIYALPGNALASKGATTYTPTLSTGCGRNYIVYISNGPSQDNNSVLTAATSMLSSAGGDTTRIALSPSGSQTNVSDEWARFMKSGPLDVTTYVIDVDPRSSGQGPGWSALLRSMATVSGGDYVAVSSAGGSAAIAEAVQKALSEIQAVNSVFASVSLPLNVTRHGTYVNEVYIGMFRPDANASPRWYGNLKHYQMGRVDGELQLLDADGSDAINSLNGSVTECARSFWTPSSPDAYWAFSPSGDCIPPAGSGSGLYRNSNSPDGGMVEKGAGAYVLRSERVNTRPLSTCSSSACTALDDFDTGNTSITAAALGVASGDRSSLIEWARGQDLGDENNNADLNEMRPSAHGDVAHSRPVAMDFGSTDAPEVVVFYGGNEGVLRAINGNRTADIGAVPAGGELWGFLAPEFYGQLQRLRDNTLQINFPNVPSPSAPKPYGMDGPITVYPGNTHTWVYATMRRGGRALYAFSVNNDDPTDITIKWRKGCPENFPETGTVSDSGCTAGFEGLGQTWSAATPFKAAGHGLGATPMLIMGGGYDTCEDTDPHTCTSSTKGNKIYVLNADTGELLKTLDTDRAVVADVVVVADSTQLARYAYTSDLGGNVYRVNIGTAAPADWTVTKVASLGCSTPDTCTSNRKFMFAPDILEQGGEYTLLLGSGDREKPLLYFDDASSVSNYFFMLRDQPANPDWLADEIPTCDTAVMCLDSLLPITTSATPDEATLDLKKGWYLSLGAGEKVVTSALTIFGAVTFSTHTPETPTLGACTANLGTARLYDISFANAASTTPNRDRSVELPPETGLPPSPVAGMVELEGDLVAFCFGCSEESAIQAEEPPLPPTVIPTQPKARVYWHIQR